MLITSEKIKFIKGVFFLLPFLFFSFASPIYAYNGHEPALKKKELETLRQRMKALRLKIEKKQDEKNTEAKFLKDIEVRIGERTHVLRKIDVQLHEQNNEFKKLKQQQRHTQIKLSNQRDILAEQIRSAYMIGKQEYLKLLLNQENPAAIDRTLTYYDYFHKARSHHIDEAVKTIAELDVLTLKIKTKAEELNALRQQQQLEKQNLEKDFSKRSVIVKNLEKDLADKSLRLKKFAADEKVLKQLLKDILNIMPSTLTEIDKRETFGKRRGRLKWPVKGQVNRLFGKSREAANVKWNGVIIASPEGKEVKAISHGRVAYADWLRGYGMLLIIDHGDGYMTLYGHNQALYKETGDWVEEGEVVAAVGRSGGEARSGLYFEVRVKGKPSNPSKWCRG